VSEKIIASYYAMQREEKKQSREMLKIVGEGMTGVERNRDKNCQWKLQ
jgi:hypothetical protein